MKNLNGKNGVYQSLQGNGLGMKGITLISLVVTIIVLLIIAGISISMLAGDNSILTMAGKAKEETKNTNELEQVQLAVTEAWMENSGTLYKETLKQKLEGKFNIIEGKNRNFFGDEPWIFIGDTSMAYEITGKGNVNIINIWNYNHNNQTVISNDGTILKIGDYIKLELEDTQNNYSGGWRVIGVEDKRLKLVSADLLNSNVTLNGRLGDAINEQGVAKVNDICNTYKNGKNVLEARSINVEDIDEIVGYNKSNFGKNEISQYGNVVTYRYTEDGTRYSGTLNSKEGIYKSSFMTVNGIYLNENNNEYTVTSTAYTYSGVSYLKNTSNEYNVLFNNSTGEYLNRYWLATEFCIAKEGRAAWGLMSVENGKVCFGDNNIGNMLVASVLYCYSSQTYAVRPIVILEFGARIDKLTLENSANDGLSQDTAWIISE